MDMSTIKEHPVYEDFTYALATDSKGSGKTTNFDKVYYLADVDNYMEKKNTSLAMVIPENVIAVDFDFKYDEDSSDEYIRNVEHSKQIVENMVEDFRLNYAPVVIHRTPSGGYHMLFKYPSKLKIANGTNKVTLSGITVVDYKTGFNGKKATIHSPYVGPIYDTNDEDNKAHLREIAHVGVTSIDDLMELPLELYPFSNKAVLSVFKSGAISNNFTKKGGRKDSLFLLGKYLSEVKWSKNTENLNFRTLLPDEIAMILRTVNSRFEFPMDKEDLHIQVVKGVVKTNEVKTDAEKAEQKNTKVRDMAIALINSKHVYTVPDARSNKDQVYWYDKGIYEIVADRSIKAAIERMQPGTPGPIISSVLEAVKTLSETKPSVMKEKEADYRYIFFNDGIYNLDTRSSQEFDPELVAYSKLAMNLPDEELLEDYALNHIRDYYHTLAKKRNAVAKSMLGLHASLLIRKQIKKVFFVYDSRGDNGKSKYQELITQMIGGTNVANLDLDVLTNKNDRFSTSNLVNKMVNFSAEADYESMASSKTLKSITGGDEIQVEVKHGASTSQALYCKLIVNTNEIPAPKDKGNAMYNRIFIIPFEHVFLKSEKDPLVVERIVKDPIMKNAMTWILLTEAQELYDNDLVIQESDVSVKLRATYRKENNSLYTVMSELNIKDVEYMKLLLHNSTRRAVYELYKDTNTYMKGNRGKTLGINNFFKEVESLFGVDELCESRKFDPNSNIDKKRLTLFNCNKFKYYDGVVQSDSAKVARKKMENLLKKHGDRLDFDERDLLHVDKVIDDAVSLAKKAEVISIALEYEELLEEM